MTDKWKGIPLLDDVTEMNRTGGNSTVGGVMMMTPKQKAHVIFFCLFRRPKRWCRLMMVDCCFQQKKSQGFIALDPQSHNFFSRLFACVFCFFLSCTMRCNLAVPLDFPVSYFLFFSFLFAQIWQPWRRNTCRIICAIFRLTNDDET